MNTCHGEYFDEAKSIICFSVSLFLGVLDSFVSAKHFILKHLPMTHVVCI